MSEKVTRQDHSSKWNSGAAIAPILVKKPSVTRLKKLGSCLNVSECNHEHHEPQGLHSPHRVR